MVGVVFPVAFKGQNRLVKRWSQKEVKVEYHSPMLKPEKNDSQLTFSVHEIKEKFEAWRRRLGNWETRRDWILDKNQCEIFFHQGGGQKRKESNKAGRILRQQERMISLSRDCKELKPGASLEKPLRA